MIFKLPIIQKTIDFLLPPQCALCREITEKPYTLCANCWGCLEFITSPQCSICSTPLDNVDRDMPCLDCIKHPPIFTKAYAPLIYNDSLKKLILRYKNYDGLHLGPMFFNWLHPCLTPCLTENINMIIPVPLHWWRFFVRQYNQANELGKLVSKHTGIKIYTNLLKRKKATASQGHKNKLLRYQNLNKAFAISNEAKVLKNATVLLIDDVLTSGATANACAQVLLDAGAVNVYVLTIARTIKNNYLKKSYGTPENL